MADISKCTNERCPKRHTCWRFNVPSSDYQSYTEYQFKVKYNNGVTVVYCDFYYTM